MFEEATENCPKMGPGEKWYRWPPHSLPLACSQYIKTVTCIIITIYAVVSPFPTRAVWWAWPRWWSCVPTACAKSRRWWSAAVPGSRRKPHAAGTRLWSWRLYSPILPCPLTIHRLDTPWCSHTATSAPNGFSACSQADWRWRIGRIRFWPTLISETDIILWLWLFSIDIILRYTIIHLTWYQ